MPTEVRSRRVLQLILHSGQGGMETVASALDEGLSHRGLEVITEPIDGQGASRLSRLRHVRELVQRHRPACLLTHSALPNLYGRLATPWSLPAIVVLHSASDDWAGRALRAAEWPLSLRTNQVVPVSERLRSEYLSRFPWMAQRVTVIHNGTTLRPPLTRRVDTDGPMLLYAARIAKTKRPHILIEAMALLAHRGLKPTLVMAGQVDDAAYGAQLQAQVKIQGLHHVKLTGPRNDIAELMRRADILVHPSAAEAHSLTLVEASVSGIPMIVTKAVAATMHRDAVYAPFNTDDPIDLALTIESMLADLDTWSNAAWDRRMSMYDLFNIEVMLDAYADLLHTKIDSALSIAS